MGLKLGIIRLLTKKKRDKRIKRAAFRKIALKILLNIEDETLKWDAGKEEKIIEFCQKEFGLEKVDSIKNNDLS